MMDALLFKVWGYPMMTDRDGNRFRYHSLRSLIFVCKENVVGKRKVTLLPVFYAFQLH